MITRLTSLTVVTRQGKRTLIRTCAGNPQILEAVTAEEAFHRFLAWLEKIVLKIKLKVILVAHSAKGCDMRHLMRHILKFDMFAKLSCVVAGFCDSLPYMRLAYKNEHPSFSLKNLYHSVFGEHFDAHNAFADVKALRRLLECTLSSKPDVDLKDYSFDLSSAVAYLKYDEGLKERLYTLQPMYQGSSPCISKGIAEKIAGSGLQYGNLKCVFDRDGCEGIEALLKRKEKGKPRVTNRQSIITSICNYMSKL